MILHRTVAAALAMASFGAIAAAADDAFKATPREPSHDWIAVLYALVALAGICVVAFKNSKRTHLD